MGSKTTHGKSRTRIYGIWCGIIKRTRRPTIGSKYYLDKGILICDRWKRFESFYEDMGDPPTNKHSIDRIDSNGDYEPSNCRWATSYEQNNNSSRCNFITYKGKTKTLTQWSKYLGIKRTTLSFRLVVCKWPVERAFEIPVISDHRCNLKGRKRIGNVPDKRL